MRQVIGGNASDTTAAALAWLAAHRQLYLANLYLIGEAEDPQAIWATDWPQALTWGPMGTFLPAVIKRGQVASKIGLDIASMDLTYSPSNLSFTQSLASTSPLHLARLGYYDNWRVRVWRCIMPTPGDANTFGCFGLFGGRIASGEVDRAQIKWTVNSWLDVIDQMVPANVIENTNSIASFAGATPPPGFAKIPQFNVVNGSSDNIIYGDSVNFPGTIFADHNMQFGWLVFNYVSGATLGGYWSVVGDNTHATLGGTGVHNEFKLYGKLPWPPTPGVDTFFVSAPLNVDKGDAGTGVFYGFPYVPAPEQI